MSNLTPEELTTLRAEDDGQEKCSRCRYWREIEPPHWDKPSVGALASEEPQVYYEGECRRHAPNIYPCEETEPEAAYWPWTTWGEWCGDFQPCSSSKGRILF